MCPLTPCRKSAPQSFFWMTLNLTILQLNCSCQQQRSTCRTSTHNTPHKQKKEDTEDGRTNANGNTAWPQCDLHAPAAPRWRQRPGPPSPSAPLLAAGKPPRRGVAAPPLLVLLRAARRRRSRSNGAGPPRGGGRSSRAPSCRAALRHRGTGGGGRGGGAGLEGEEEGEEGHRAGRAPARR